MGIAELAQAFEAQQRVVVEAQSALMELKEELAGRIGTDLAWDVAALDGAEPSEGTNGHASARRRRVGRKKFFGGAQYWDDVRAKLLASMDAGALYTGADLEAMAGANGGPETFVRQVRQPLLKSRKIKKVAEDGSAWRKGMFPASARWTKN